MNVVLVDPNLTTVHDKHDKMIPPLVGEDLRLLQASIYQHGVLQPVILSRRRERLVVVDGAERRNICIQLKLELPAVMKDFADERSEIFIAITLNSNRKHFTKEQRHTMLTFALLNFPEKTDALIARELMNNAVSDKTVARRRAELESVSEIPKLDYLEGADGKMYPATKPRAASSKPRDDFALIEHQAQRAQLLISGRLPKPLEDAAHLRSWIGDILGVPVEDAVRAMLSDDTKNESETLQELFVKLQHYSATVCAVPSIADKERARAYS